jgi:hypothetical protein
MTSRAAGLLGALCKPPLLSVRLLFGLKAGAEVMLARVWGSGGGKSAIGVDSFTHGCVRWASGWRDRDTEAGRVRVDSLD